MSEKALVIYDAKCRFCAAAVRRLERLDLFRRLSYGDARDPALLARHAGVDSEKALERLHLVTQGGAILDGFFAFRWLSGRLPLLWIFWPFLWLPGAAVLGVRLYDFIARKRFAFGTCEGEVCQTPIARRSETPETTRDRPLAP
jgi:predicted DCC family thiol-disulfide oxidoreductase YuxK